MKSMLFTLPLHTFWPLPILVIGRLSSVEPRYSSHLRRSSRQAQSCHWLCRLACGRGSILICWILNEWMILNSTFQHFNNSSWCKPPVRHTHLGLNRQWGVQKSCQMALVPYAFEWSVRVIESFTLIIFGCSPENLLKLSLTNFRDRAKLLIQTGTWVSFLLQLFLLVELSTYLTRILSPSFLRLPSCGIGLELRASYLLVDALHTY
jgi:hypothetical protein